MAKMLHLTLITADRLCSKTQRLISNLCSSLIRTEKNNKGYFCHCWLLGWKIQGLQLLRLGIFEVAFPTCSTRGQYTNIQHEMKMAKSCILMCLGFNIHIRVHIKQHQSITNHSSHHCAKIVTLYKNSLKKVVVSHSLGSISVYGKNIVFSKLDFVFFVLYKCTLISL